MRLYSYVVEHDKGFAPNPFFGICTLATCKPRIRQVATIGDYIIGTGAAKRRRQGYLTYFMRVERIITFDDYWADPQFARKKPRFNAGLKFAYGDNIYHRVNGDWVQEDSFHSYPGGEPHPENLRQDTSSEKVLLSTDFAYWGGSGPQIPSRFRDYDGVDVVVGRQGHKSRKLDSMAEEFVDWLRSLGVHGYLGDPLEWSYDRR